MAPRKNELLGTSGLTSLDFGDGGEPGRLTRDEMDEIARAVVDIAQGDTKKALDEIRVNLDKAFDSGMEANDQRVKDLEKRLIEKEQELEAQLKKLEEEARLRQAEMRAIGTAQTRPEGGPVDPMRVDYRGCFIAHDMVRALVEANTSADGVQALANLTDDQKRAIDTGKIATAGRLPTEVADRFIDLIVAETATLSRITNRRMVSPEARLDEMFVANRRIARATEGVAPSPADAVSFTGRTLTTEEVIWAEDITLSFLEDNIERQNAEANIVAALARQFGTDLNDLGWNGVDDTGAGFTNIRKGWAQLIADSIAGGGTAGVDKPNVVDIATPPTSVSALFRAMHKAIPQRYKARPDYGYTVPSGTAERYADEVQQRETGTGDAVLLNGFPALRYFGRPVVPDSHSDAKPYLFPVPFGFFGIHRNIRIDGDFRPRRRAIEYTITARIGYQVVGLQCWVTTSADLPASLK